jgi:preprotein translocase subunit SecG
MQIVLLVIHVLIALALITVVLLQKSEGGGLGMGGGMSGFMTGRSAANLLTRTTGILFACFIATSVLLAVLAARQHAGGVSILDRIPTGVPTTLPQPAPAPASKSTAPAVPAAKPAGGVPLAN